MLFQHLIGTAILILKLSSGNIAFESIRGEYRQFEGMHEQIKMLLLRNQNKKLTI